MHIRPATQQDTPATKQLIMATFPKEEHEVVAQLAAELLSEVTTPPCLSLVAEVENRIIGYVAFSPFVVEGADNCSGYILAPLAVSADFQKQGVGSRLVKEGIQQLTEQGCQLLIVYGDPAYYSRFGFGVELAEQFIAPYPLEYPFGWQAMRLNGYLHDTSTRPIHCQGPLNKGEFW